MFNMPAMIAQFPSLTIPNPPVSAERGLAAHPLLLAQGQFRLEQTQQFVAQLGVVRAEGVPDAQDRPLGDRHSGCPLPPRRYCRSSPGDGCGGGLVEHGASFRGLFIGVDNYLSDRIGRLRTIPTRRLAAGASARVR